MLGPSLEVVDFMSSLEGQPLPLPQACHAHMYIHVCTSAAVGTSPCSTHATLMIPRTMHVTSQPAGAWLNRLLQLKPTLGPVQFKSEPLTCIMRCRLHVSTLRYATAGQAKEACSTHSLGKQHDASHSQGTGGKSTCRTWPAGGSGTVPIMTRGPMCHRIQWYLCVLWSQPSSKDKHYPSYLSGLHVFAHSKGMHGNLTATPSLTLWP